MIKKCMMRGALSLAVVASLGCKPGNAPTTTPQPTQASTTTAETPTTTTPTPPPSPAETPSAATAVKDGVIDHIFTTNDAEAYTVTTHRSNGSVLVVTLKAQRKHATECPAGAPLCRFKHIHSISSQENHVDHLAMLVDPDAAAAPTLVLRWATSTNPDFTLDPPVTPQVDIDNRQTTFVLPDATGTEVPYELSGNLAPPYKLTVTVKLQS
jgi:hypothetical protein